MRLSPKNMELLIFVKYNLRAIDNDIDSLPIVPSDWSPPNKNVLPEPISLSSDPELLSASESDDNDTDNATDNSDE